MKPQQPRSTWVSVSHRKTKVRTTTLHGCKMLYTTMSLHSPLSSDQAMVTIPNADPRNV